MTPAKAVNREKLTTLADGRSFTHSYTGRGIYYSESVMGG